MGSAQPGSQFLSLHALTTLFPVPVELGTKFENTENVRQRYTVQRKTTKDSEDRCEIKNKN